jgi:release factor glutamine methyltransferase
VTSGELIREISLLLRQGGIDVPRLEAEVLLACLLGCSRSDLLIEGDREVPPGTAEKLRLLAGRRLAGEPLAYITGEREFMSLSFLVTSAVLIPRPETELLVELLLDRLGGDPVRRVAVPGSADRGKPLGTAAAAANGGAACSAGTAPGRPGCADSPLVADVGTGSGAIAVSLAYYNPRLRLLAIDRSAEALAVAAGNAARHGVAGRIDFLQGDLLQPLLDQTPGAESGAGGLRGRGTAVAANLPYIPSGLLHTLPPDVRQEPRLALDGGEDGLDLYRRLLPQAAAFLAPGGLLACEIGDGQGVQLTQLLHDSGWQQVRVLSDYAGQERIAVGVRA